MHGEKRTLVFSAGRTPKLEVHKVPIKGIPSTNSSGTTRWRAFGLLHREGGPAVEWSSGNKEWWVHGERHREEGPAVEWYGGHKEWWLNGKRHRVDGPAIELKDGRKEWWINGEELTEEDHDAWREANVSI